MALGGPPCGAGPRTIARGMPVHAEIRRNATLVDFAGVAFLAMQVAAGGLVRPLSVEELALLPASDLPLWAVRAPAMLLASTALVTAFRAWVRPAGRVAAAAAFFFAGSWLPVVAGPQVGTPLYSALAVIAAAGFTTRWLVERDRGALAATSVATALVVWWHPEAGAGLATGLLGVLLVWGRTSAGPGVAAVAVGTVVGGAVAGAVDAAALARPLGTGPGQWWIPMLVTLTVGALAVVVAVADQRWPHRRNAAVVGVAIAGALLGVLALLQGVSPTLLLPVYGLLCVAVGSGVLAAWHLVRRMSTVIPTLVLAAAAVVLVVVQLVFAVQADGHLGGDAVKAAATSAG